MKKNSFFFISLFCIQIGFAQQQSPSIISIGKLVRISPKLIDIKDPNPANTKTPKPEDPKYLAYRANINKRVKFSIDNPSANSTDQAIQKDAKPGFQIKAPNSLIGTFEGAGTVDNTAAGFGLFTPPDPVMSVGPNHVVQMINSVHKVFNKSGTVLTGPLKFSAIAATSTDDGDPITLYDHIADRWILLQFSSLFTNGAESLIFCVSQTNDPTGAYFVYEFQTPGKFPDYPHVGIWNNSYVVTTHNFNTAGTSYLGQGYWAFDRKKMVNGEPTVTGIGFQDGTTGGYLPASFEGFKTPDAGADPMFATFDADEFGGTDQLQIRTLTPNFVNPASSVLSAVTNLPTAAFDARNPSANSIEQSGTAVRLDQLADRMMSRIIYRRFDNYESMVMNYAVNVSGVNPTGASTYQAAKRWYELTRPNSASPWVINQQSTYSPDAGNGATGRNRWMGSVGIDQKGNMGLAYSRSSTTNFPDIYFAERKKTDALSTFGTEQLFHASGGSQTTSGGRWGDYSAMSTDPTDEETMWFTAEYYASTVVVDFKTRIGSFKVNDPATAPTVHFQLGGTIARQKESTTLLPPSTFYKDHPITVMIDQAPSQNVNLTITKTGTATEGGDYDLLNVSPIVLNGSTLSQTFTLRVYDDIIGETDEFIDLAYTLNANGGNGIAAAYNQKHRITIIGKVICPTANVSIVRPTTFCEGDSVILNANADPNYTFQWYKNNTAIGGATVAQYIAKTGGNYRVEVTRAGCTISSTTTNVVVNVGTPPPTTVSRTIAVGTVITAGNGLQASALCPINQTTTYSGPTVGYDNGTKSGADPTVSVSGAGTSLVNVKVSVIWRKRSGGGVNDCGTTGGAAAPYFNEVSFRIQSPTGTIINLLNSNTYGIGTSPLASITTVFEDGSAPFGALPASGTFSPNSPLSALVGINPTGTWTLLANDNGSADPLCVMGFSVTIIAPSAGGASTISWYNSATGGAALATASEYIPTDTAPGTYTYFAEANCSGLATCATSIRKPATLTITGVVCNTVGGTVSADATVCAGSNSGTLTLTGQTGSVVRWESSTDNFVSVITPIVNTTTSQSYTNLTQTTKFRAVVKDGTCPEANSAAATITIGVALTPPTGISNPAVCGNATSSLSATCASGSVTWYNAAGLTSLFTGSPFVTPVLTANTAYKVRCESAGCMSTFVDVAVTVNPIPIVAANANQVICAGATASLSATCNLLTVNATLSGSSEVPVNASTATGSAIGTFNVLTNQLDLTISFNGLSSNATAAHIHNAAVGVNGPVIIGFSSVPSATSGTFMHSSLLSATHAAALLAGNTYVNVHNAIFPGGEVRGQISTTCAANTYTWNPGSLSGATVVVSPSTTTVYTVTAANLTSGCSATATTMVTVNTVSATVSNAGPYIVGQNIQLNATGGTSYSWAGPNAFTSTINNPMIAGATLAMNGIYTVTVTQGLCSATATTMITVTDNNPCVAIVDYDYVQAGNPFVFKFPLINNMVIAEVPEETSILVNPICPTVSIESFKMKITGLPYLHETVESIYYFALFNNTGAYILGRNFLPGNYALTVTGYDQDNALGNITYGPVITNFTIVSNSASISTPTFTINSLCAGTTFNVSFTATGAFNPANMFEVQLSDANGTFDNPTVIGSSTSAGVVACTIPINISLGSNYKIRVVSTNQIVVGGSNTSNLTAVTASLNLVSPTNDISIGTSTKQASQTITATNKVLSPANTTYKAGNAILLNAGFQASSSSVFKAEIGGCN